MKNRHHGSAASTVSGSTGSGGSAGNFVALRLEVTKMSAKMAEEVVSMKNRHQGSAASTASGSTGSGGDAGNFAPRLVQNTFMASRIDMKGWGCWRNIRGTGITLDEAKELVSVNKARIKQDDLNVFDWDLTDRDQGNFDTKIMVFLWFKEEVTPMVRKRFQLDLQQDFTNHPLPFKLAIAMATLELDPAKPTLEQGPGNFHWCDEGIRQTPA